MGITCIDGNGHRAVEPRGTRGESRKHAGEDGQLTRTGTVVGTLPYMAPEQHLALDPAGGPLKPLTWAADVYGLGVILYELITGQRPFVGKNEAEIVKAKNSAPADPRTKNARIERDLERICLRCLEKDPERRYVSAQALALRRYLDGEAFEGAGRAERAWRWCLRHPVMAGLMIAAVLFLLMMTPSTIALARGQEAAKRAQIAEVNKSSAAMVAGTVLSQLRALSDAVERVASEQGEIDGIYWFTISAPIFGGNRRPIGVLVASVPTAETLGSLVVRETQSVAVLVAPRDRERATPEPASTHLILLHPDYTYGEGIPIENEQVQKLDEASRDASLRIERPLGLPPPDLVTSSDDYEDPVAIKYSQYAGRWLAGFAPVGNTGFVVIVQTHADKTLEPERKLGGQLVKWAGISASPGALLVLLATWYRRSRRGSRGSPGLRTIRRTTTIRIPGDRRGARG